VKLRFASLVEAGEWVRSPDAYACVTHRIAATMYTRSSSGNMGFALSCVTFASLPTDTYNSPYCAASLKKATKNGTRSEHTGSK
jgi:hypothetical protein